MENHPHRPFLNLGPQRPITLLQSDQDSERFEARVAESEIKRNRKGQKFSYDIVNNNRKMKLTFLVSCIRFVCKIAGCIVRKNATTRCYRKFWAILNFAVNCFLGKTFVAKSSVLNCFCECAIFAFFH